MREVKKRKLEIVSKYLEDCNCGPEQGVEIFPVTDPSFGVYKLAAEQIHSQDTEMFQRFRGFLPRTDRNVHLNMKIKRASSPKKTATLSMVLSITMSCLRRLGRNLTSFKIRRSLKVLRTERPDPSSVTP